MKHIFLSVSQRIFWISITYLFSTLAAHAQSTVPKNLFVNDSVIQIEIEAPFRKIISRAERSTDPHPGVIRVKNSTPETHIITVAARGKSRRRKENCQFPPLRVKFAEKPTAPAVFAKQKSLKLVTHCRKRDKAQQNTLLEYSAYRIHNKITENSLRVRLARINYIDADSRKPVATRYGFFIEDMDDAAKRNGMKEIDIPRVDSKQLNDRAAVKTILLHYLISNLDWSISRGPPGADCCHNGKLMGAAKSSTSNLIAVPYDFDQSGLVDAPYSVVPDKLPVRNVRQRLYRGFCRQNDLVRGEAQSLLQKRKAILSIFDNITGLEDKRRAKAKSFIEEGFNNLADPQKFEKEIIGKCR